MKLTFQVLGYAIALLWLLILNGNHVTGSFPLPNPIESPHLKNQSLVSCLSKYDPTMSIKATPNKPSCQELVLITGSFTLFDNVLSLACYSKVYLDGKVLVTDSVANACVGVKQVECPILKGHLQKFYFYYHRPCVLSSGYYQIKGHCINQDDKMVACVEWKFRWDEFTYKILITEGGYS